MKPTGWTTSYLKIIYSPPLKHTDTFMYKHC